MEGVEQAQAYAAADFAASDTAFVERFVALFGTDHDGEIADLGCGPGNIALTLATRLPTARIVGIDGSAAMIAIARQRGRRLAERVRFVEARVPDPALSRAHFSAVVSNSLLHHLPDPAALWSTVTAIGRPGAPVLIGDLRRPASAAEARHIVDIYAPDAPAVLRDDFLASLHAAFEPDEVRAQLKAAGLHRWRVEVTSDRHLQVVGTVEEVNQTTAAR